MGNLFEELKRRKVFRVATVYAIVAWLLIQVAGEVLPTFGAPNWVNQTLIFLFALGFIPTLIAAWAYEITPDGIKLDVEVSDAEPNSTKPNPYPIAIAAVAILIAFGLLFMTLNQSSNERRARLEVLPELLSLVEEGRFAEAFTLGQEIESIIPDDSALSEAMSTATVSTRILTQPPNARVYIRPYGDKQSEWQFLGRAPVEEVRWPRGLAAELRLEAEGYETRTVASGVPGFYLARNPPQVIELVSAGSVPEGMVFIPGGSFPQKIRGIPSVPVNLGPYYLDQDEVTNAEFDEFIRAGGYERENFWEVLEFLLDGRQLPWEEAMSMMVDATGRPGPATWEFGAYPTGQDNYPVTGVSWYEAVAYTRFRGISLPTLYHWERAAVEPHSMSQYFPAAMLPLANFGGSGPIATAASGAMGPNGTYDMAGNVKEWVLNSSGSDRWLLGGGWLDDNYLYMNRFTSPPFDRSPMNGIRGAMYPQGNVPDALTSPILSVSIEISDVTPVSEEVFDAFLDGMRYIPSEEINVQQVSVDTSHPEWRHEVVSLPASNRNERFDLHLFFPSSDFAIPPYQPIIHFPGTGGFTTPREFNTTRALIANGFRLGDLVRSGRVLVWPQWAGSFERWDDFLTQPPGDQGLRAIGTKMRDWATELGRTIDYLESRPDIDDTSIAYYGYSFGGSTPLPLLVLEDRLTAALIYLGGYPRIPAPPAADLAHYAPRITIPVLMLGGSTDLLFPIETSARPLFERLGTDPAMKQLRIYNIGHVPPPRQQFLQDALPWLDKYLGEVRQSGN